MNTVTWIKLDAGIFQNRKIRHIRTLRDGDRLVLFFIMLLTVAGRCNDGGKIYMSEGIPYTRSSLAEELGLDVETVGRGMSIFRKFGMIDGDTRYPRIAGWEENQNIDGLEKMKEQNRIRQKKWYEDAKKKEEDEKKKAEREENIKQILEYSEAVISGSQKL